MTVVNTITSRKTTNIYSMKAKDDKERNKMDITFLSITRTHIWHKDTLALLFFIIKIDYVLRKSIDNKDTGLTLSKLRSRRYPANNITDADNADDLVIFADSSRNDKKNY